MHGPAFTGDTKTALFELADEYDRRLNEALVGRELLSA
jgi:hypothetical protein